jgi:hypothetical protein
MSWRRRAEIALTTVAVLSIFVLYAVRFPPFENLIFRYYSLPRLHACIDATWPPLLKFIAFNDHFGEAFVPWTVSWISALSLCTLIAWRHSRVRIPLLAGAAVAGPVAAFLTFATWNMNALGIGCTWWRDPPHITCISIDDPEPHPCPDPRL